MNNNTGSLIYGKEHIVYEVIYSQRKTMEIAVHPDVKVTVKVPKGTESEKIASRITKRARWIKRQLDYFRQFHPLTSPRLSKCMPDWEWRKKRLEMVVI